MQFNLQELKSFCSELKHVFAPIEKQTEHIACIALDVLCDKLEHKGVEFVSTPPGDVAIPDAAFNTIVPAEFRPFVEQLFQRVLKSTAPRSCIDCIPLSGAQLRGLLESRGAGCQKAATFVTDDIEYPLSLDVLMQLCMPTEKTVELRPVP